jgi:hypothetical protein
VSALHLLSPNWSLLTVLAIEGIFQVHWPFHAVLTSWLNGEIASAHGRLPHVVDTMEEMRFVVARQTLD